MRTIILFLFVCSCICHAADAVGDVRQFFQKNFDSGGYEVVNARCKKVDSLITLWVDSFIGADEDLLSLFTVDFQSHVYKKVQPNYGEVPDINGDSLITVLFTRISDESDRHKVYFDPVNQYSPTQSGYENSNYREMLYIDYDFYINHKNETRRQSAAALVEMICWNYQPAKPEFLKNGLAQYSALFLNEETIWDLYNDYSATNTSLFENVDTDAFLGKCYVFMKFLIQEKTNLTALAQLTQNTDTSGKNAVSQVIGEDFDSILWEYSLFVFNRAGFFEKASSQFFHELPVMTQEVTLKSYEPVGIRISKFWPDYSIILSEFSGSGTLKAGVHYFRDELSSTEVINYSNGAIFTPKWDYEAQDVTLVLMNCTDGEESSESTVKVSVSHSDYSFAYMSNAILRDQIVFFVSSRYELSGCTVKDPQDNETSLNLTQIEDFKYFSSYSAADSGSHTVTFSGTDQSGNAVSQSFKMIVGAYELDYNTMF